MISDEHVVQGFKSRFQSSPQWISQAPGRVNLIGEHTDYNGGFVLPCAINRNVKIAARLRRDDSLNLFSESYNESVSFSLSSRIPLPKIKGWYSYFIAVADQFMSKKIAVPGMDAYICGDVPHGAGLSSSAAFEVCVATLLNHVCHSGFSPKEIALLSQRAENSEYVGVRCGIMDQFISALGEKDHALLIDCHALEEKAVPFNSRKAAILIIDSMKKRGLVDSEYNQRRKEAEEGFRLIRQLSGMDYPSIRHIPMDLWKQYRGKLSEKSRKRIEHNLTENQRALDFVKALEREDFQKAGKLLYASHKSLKNDYEVSCPELDTIVDIAGRREGVFGCRMTGAGFGGCAVSLAQPSQLKEITESLSREYESACGKKPEIYITTAESGATIQPI
ncbi:galactokinase [Candidatus Sumerlaeota bacterium]|nr:galactokinase [Candidatus Sumerlaeota bacterium]